MTGESEILADAFYKKMLLLLAECEGACRSLQEMKVIPDNPHSVLALKRIVDELFEDVENRQDELVDDALKMLEVMTPNEN